MVKELTRIVYVTESLTQIFLVENYYFSFIKNINIPDGRTKTSLDK